MNKIKAMILTTLVLASSTSMPMIKNDWLKKIQAIVPFAALGVAGYALWQTREAHKAAAELKDKSLELKKDITSLQTKVDFLETESNHVRTDYATLALLILQEKARLKYPVYETIDEKLRPDLTIMIDNTSKDILIGRIAETLLASNHATMDKQKERSRKNHADLIRTTSKAQLQKPGLPKKPQL